MSADRGGGGGRRPSRSLRAALLLYPRAVRRRHGADLAVLVQDVIEAEGRSRSAVIGRLALDGLIQRLTAPGTAWVTALTLAVTSIGGLAVSDFAAASAHQRVAPARAAPRHAGHRPGGRIEGARAPSPDVIPPIGRAAAGRAHRPRRRRLG